MNPNRKQWLRYFISDLNRTLEAMEIAKSTSQRVSDEYHDTMVQMYTTLADMKAECEDECDSLN